MLVCLAFMYMKSQHDEIRLYDMNAVANYRCRNMSLFKKGEWLRNRFDLLFLYAILDFSTAEIVLQFDENLNMG